MIIGIDPGSTCCAVVAYSRGVIEWVQYDTPCKIRTSLALANPKTDKVVLEFPQSRGGITPGQSTFNTCRNAGRLEQMCRDMGMPVYGLYPSTHYTFTTGVPNPKGGVLKACLVDRIGEAGNKKNPGPLYSVSRSPEGQPGCTDHLRDALSVAYAAECGPIEEWMNPHPTAKKPEPKPTMWRLA